MFSWLPYFSSKLFGFSCIRLLVCFRIISSDLIEFHFVVLECPVLSILFYTLPVLSVCFLKLNCYFSLCCLFFFVSRCASRSFRPVLVDFFLFAFPVEFSILVLIFFFVAFEGIPIFSRSNFPPA